MGETDPSLSDITLPNKESLSSSLLTKSSRPTTPSVKAPRTPSMISTSLPLVDITMSTVTTLSERTLLPVKSCTSAPPPNTRAWLMSLSLLIKVVGTDLFLPLPGRSGQWIPATTQDSLVFGFEDDQKGVWTWITGSEDEGFIISKEAKIGLVEFGIASEYFLASKMDVRHTHTVKNKCSLPSDMLEINA